MKLKLVESAGTPLDKIRGNVELMMTKLSQDFNIQKARTLDKNKFMSYYYGTYKDKPLTLIVNTSNSKIENDQDVFFSILDNGVQVPLGGAKATDSNALNDLFNFYFEEKDAKLRAEEEDRLKQEEIEKANKEKEELEKAERLSRDEENNRIAEENELKSIKLEYKQLTNKDLPEDIELDAARVRLSQAKFVSDIDKYVTELSNADFQANMTVSFKNSDSNLSGYFNIVKYTKDQFSIEDKRPKEQFPLSVVTKDKLINILASQVTEFNSLPSMLSIRDKSNNTIDSKIY